MNQGELVMASAKARWPRSHDFQLPLRRTKLDFIHFSEFASQLIGSETHVLFVLKGWHALLADHLEQCHWRLRPRRFSTGSATRESPAPWRRPCPGQADGDRDALDHGPQRSA